MLLVICWSILNSFLSELRCVFSVLFKLVSLNLFFLNWVLSCFDCVSIWLCFLWVLWRMWFCFVCCVWKLCLCCLFCWDCVNWFFFSCLRSVFKFMVWLFCVKVLMLMLRVVRLIVICFIVLNIFINFLVCNCYW